MEAQGLVIVGHGVRVRDHRRRDDLALVAQGVGGHAAFVVDRQDVLPVGYLAGVQRHDGALRSEGILHAAAVVGHGIEQLVAVTDHHLLNRLVGARALGGIGDSHARLFLHGGPVLGADLVYHRRPKLELLGVLSR